MLKVLTSDTDELTKAQRDALEYLDEARAAILDPKFRSVLIQVIRDPEGDPEVDNCQVNRWFKTRHDVSMLEVSGAMLEAAISTTPTGCTR